MAHDGLGGVAASRQFVIVSDRDLTDSLDVFHCFQAHTGELVWRHEFPALGKLDYGNCPRTTPLIDGERVFLLGAFGDLHCLTLATGEVRWQTNLATQFENDEPLVWGYCSSPLLAEGKLIVNPGGPGASLAALDPETGSVLWASPGGKFGYGSFITIANAGKRQIVGHDRLSLGGWDPVTGRRLWTLTPPKPRDFNVPTPVQIGEQLLICTENNGARLFGFRTDGQAGPVPAAQCLELAPDMSTPTVEADRVFCVWDRLHCLDLRAGLRPLWSAEDSSFADFGIVIAAPGRVLTIGRGGTLLLLDSRAEHFQVLSKTTVFGDDCDVFAHPAVVGNRLYLRGPTSLLCLSLTDR